jgi:hypothetical protein
LRRKRAPHDAKEWESGNHFGKTNVTAKS